MVRSDLQFTLHRLANHLECQLVELFRDLINEGRVADAQEITYTACNLIEKLREAHDGKVGDA